MIRKDLVPRCGPLGGIYTALKTSRSRAEMFLACDMPFVSVCLLRRLFKFWELRGGPVFMSTGRRPGFPFLLPVEALPQIEAQIAKKEFSLQDLALGLEAGLLRARLEEKRELFNINTPADWRLAEERWRAGFACKSGL
jgi:molybdopterin-guanine dinucleotide biosynthesis protein A